MKTTGELRAELAKCFIKARDGTLQGDELRGVIGCANQINTSMAVEAKLRGMAAKEGETVGRFGTMPIS